MKLGLIDYSNSWPFLKHFRELDWPSLEIFADIPSGLNARLAKGQLDVSAVSAFECLIHPEDYFILPEWSINSKRHVRSVMLFSKKPFYELQGARIGLTSHSATSTNLLKILMKKQGLEATYHSENSPDLDALLLIGDPALTFSNPTFPHSTDLAQAWTQGTGTPMVFAVMAVRREVHTKFKDELQRLIKELSIARKSFSQGLGPLKVNMEERFPNIPLDFDEYFSCLDFSFDQDCRKGLETYAYTLSDHGFIPTFTNLPYLD